MARIEIIECIKMALDDAQLNHVQALLVAYKGNMAIKLTSIDNDRMKEKTKGIMANYKEFVTMVRETKTTLIYNLGGV